MVEGMKIVRRICNAAPLRDYVADEFLPGDKVQTDEDWLAYCARWARPCSIRPRPAACGAVVDSQLRVKGVQGLRVVDASVMPAVPSGNINAAVIAVAEKGADLVEGITLDAGGTNRAAFIGASEVAQSVIGRLLPRSTRSRRT